MMTDKYLYLRAMRFSIIALIFLFSFSACKKDLQRPSWDVDVATPILYSSMDIGNLLPDSILNSATNGEVSLVFNQSIFYLDLDSLLQIPDTTIKDTFTIPPPFPSVNVNPGQTIISITENQRFDANGPELKFAKIKSGTSDFQISSTITQPTIYEYKIFNATKNGIPFSISINVPAGSQSSPAIVSGSFDFSDYDFDLRGVSGSEFNKYQTQIKVILDPAASAVTVTNQDKVIVDNSFSNLKPAYAEGYFGSEEVDIPYEETVFDFLSNITNGSLDLDQVDIDFNIINGIGVDARITIDTLLSKNTRVNNDVLLTHSVIGNPININRAVNNGTTAVESLYSTTMNNGNSNVDLFLENLPDRIGYSLKLFVNPLGNVSGHQDFLYADKSFDVRVNANIPLNIIANDLTLVDTLALNLNVEEVDNINHGVIHVIANNGFPLEADLQILLLDDNNNITDSIVLPNTIYSAYTNTSNIVTASRVSNLDITLDNDQMDLLIATQKVILRVKFNTSSLSQHVQIYDTYKIDLKVTTEFNYTLE